MDLDARTLEKLILERLVVDDAMLPKIRTLCEAAIEFANAAVVAERDACARIADSQYSAIDDDPEDYVGKGQHSDSWKGCSMWIGQLIRARGKVES